MSALMAGRGLAAAAVSGAMAVLGASPAGAVDLKVVGAWTAFQTQTSDGTGICGISTKLSDARTFQLKWFKGDNYLTVQVFKDTWQIPAKVTSKVSLKLGTNTAWTAGSVPPQQQSSMVEFSFPKPVVQQFVTEFTTSTAGSLTFPGGSEPAWALDLTGGSGALTVMAQCIDGVAAPGEDTPLAYMRATQPFGGGRPTQPVPTQPVPGQPVPVQPVAPRPTQPF